MRRPLFNFLAVAGAVLLAAIGVSAHAQGGTNLFAAFTDFTKTTLHTDVSTDESGGSEAASGARENDNDQGEAPEASPSPEPTEAPDQDNDEQGENNDEQGDDDNGGAATGGGGDDGGGGD